MLTRFFATLLAGLSLSAATAVQAAPAQALSLSNTPAAVRASSTAGASNEAVGGAGFYILGAVVAGLAIWGIVELASDDDEPDSP